MHESSKNLEFNAVLASKQADWTANKTDAHADEVVYRLSSSADSDSRESKTNGHESFRVLTGSRLR